MEPPFLKLVIVQGPRKGDTLEFPPGSTIRIGRIIRGNNLCIRDAGISSNHLVIGSESGKWNIQDLESSNGTSLNSTKLPPLQRFPLSHSDTVKLGETTSILVQINHQEQPPRRNNRRGARGALKIETAADNPGQQACGSEENTEACEVEEKLVTNMNCRRRGRPRNNRETDSVGTVTEARALRSTRGRKNEDCLVLESLEEGCRKTREGRRKRQNLQHLPPAEDVKEVCVAVDEKQKRGTTHLEELESKRTRRGRSRKQGLQDLSSEDVKAVCVGEYDKEKSEGTHLEELENKRSRRGRSRRQDSQELPPEDVKEVCVGNDEKMEKEKGFDKCETEKTNEFIMKRENLQELREEKDAREGDVGEDLEKNTKGLDVEKDSEEVGNKLAHEKEVEENVKLGELEKECGEASSKNEEGMKDGDKLGKAKAKIDLEKMTLGELFDYMEEHLPRQITEATEEMINGLRSKAERVREYMMDQKRQRGVEIVG